MKKTQVALAALALVASTAVLANGVTVSGSLDAGIANQNAAAGGSKKMTFADGNWNGGSYFTVSGSEDAGSGLKVGFTLQTGFNMTNGTMANGGTIPATDGSATTSQGVFNRQANISVGGDFGTVTVGQQLNTYIAGAAGTELANTAFGSFFVNSIVNAANGGIAGGFFSPNAISYSLPSIGGISSTITHQIRGAGDRTSEATSASGSVGIGDVKVSAGYINRTDVGTAYTIGGLVPLGDFNVNLRYTSNNPAGNTDAATQFQFGASYALSEAVTLSAQHASRSGSGTGKLTNLSAYYALSKSTGVYAMYSNARDGMGMFYSGGATAVGGSANSVAVGAVKNF